MTFSSAIFLFAFLPITIIGNLIIRPKYRNLFLLICSAVFYLWAQPRFLWLLAGTVIIDYGTALGIQKLKYRKLILILGIILNVGILVYFKYFNFIINIFNVISGSERIGLLNIVLPVGISFFTFKGISYLADVYNKKTEADKNIINVALYITMFMEILSGPIDRYADINGEIKERSITVEDLNVGIERFVFGLAKKVIIADTLGVIVDMIWNCGAGTNSWKTAWLGSIAYSLQLFFDFSGYSDMAIGIGRMLGFRLAENFNYPYISKSVTEFWKRWHITLGAWFRNYIYIPLGGNKKNVYLNLFIVFLITGIWHGASLTFVLWGIINGILVLIERFASKEGLLKGIPSAIRSVLGRFYLLFSVNLLFVIFRAPDITSAWAYIKSMFGVLSAEPSGISVNYYLTRWNVFIIAIAILLCLPIIPAIRKKLEKYSAKPAYIVIKYVIIFVIMLLAIIRLVNITYSSFIYFQF